MRDTTLSALITAAIFVLIAAAPADAAFICAVTTTCTSPAVVVFRMSSTSNAHAELPSQSNYPNLVCCSGISGLGNSCSDTGALTALKLVAASNSHVQENTQTGYANNACISLYSGTLSLGYQANNCNGYDTTLASVSDVTNAHVGDANAFATKICASAAPPWLSFSVDSGSQSFQSMLPGSFSATSSALSVSTNNTNGFSVTVNRSATAGTLINGSDASAYIPDKTVWSAPGATTTIGNATASTTQPLTLQFRVRKTGTDTPDYASFWWGTDDTTPNARFAGFPTTAQTIANRSTAAPATTTVQILYNIGIPALQETGTYTGDITYSVTTNL